MNQRKVSSNVIKEEMKMDIKGKIREKLDESKNSDSIQKVIKKLESRLSFARTRKLHYPNYPGRMTELERIKEEIGDCEYMIKELKDINKDKDPSGIGSFGGDIY